MHRPYPTTIDLAGKLVKDKHYGRKKFMTLGPGVNVINFFTKALMLRMKKLKCVSAARLSALSNA
jgi:hypothetical protein